MTEKFLIFLGVQVISCQQPTSVAGLESVKKKNQLLPADSARVTGALARIKQDVSFALNFQAGEDRLTSWGGKTTQTISSNSNKFFLGQLKLFLRCTATLAWLVSHIKHRQMVRQLCFHPIHLLCCKNSKSQSCELLHSAFLERFMAQARGKFPRAQAKVSQTRESWTHDLVMMPVMRDKYIIISSVIFHLA